jgi:hypothetical protein
MIAIKTTIKIMPGSRSDDIGRNHGCIGDGTSNEGRAEILKPGQLDFCM